MGRIQFFNQWSWMGNDGLSNHVESFQTCTDGNMSYNSKPWLVWKLFYTNIFAYYIVDYLIYQQPNMHHCTDITTWVTKWSFPKMGLPLNHPFWEDSIINVYKPSSCWVFSWAKPGRCVFRPKRKLWAWKAPPLCVLVDHVGRPCEKKTIGDQAIHLGGSISGDMPIAWWFIVQNPEITVYWMGIIQKNGMNERV